MPMSSVTFDPFQANLAPTVALSLEGVILRVNPGFVDAFDWPAQQVEGKTLQELCHEEDQPRIPKALASLIRGVPLVTFELRIPGRHIAEMRFAFRCVKQDQTIFATIDDISTRTRLEANDSKFRSLVDYAADSWVIHDMDGKIVDANQYACDSLGYTKEELLQMQVSDFEMTIRPGKLDGVWSRMEVGRPVTVEGRHRRKDGYEYPVEVRLGLFRVHNEVLMLALSRDITKRKEAESQLQELNEHLESMVAARTQELNQALGHLKAILDNLVDGIIAINPQGYIAEANPASSELLRQPQSALVGHYAGAVLDPQLFQLAKDSMLHREVLELEVMLPHNRIAHAAASPIFGEAEGGQKSIIGSVALIRDVTVEREVDRMKTDFIATVSHELRTPLTSVLGFAKLTRGKLEKNVFPQIPEDNRKAQRTIQQVRGNVDIIIEEGERLTSLINDVLDISKMEAARIEWKMELLDPASIAERALAATAGLFAEEEGIELVREIEQGLSPIEGDADRLQQVLINLLSNAVKFTHEGSITVSASAREDGIEFSVTDTGTGIDAEQHEAIFEKFKQVGDTLTNKPQGTGLGLPISKQIVEHHKGRLWVESALGQGARFAFLIPYSGAHSPEKLDAFVERLRQHVDRLSPSDLGKKDILVVDDDKSLRELLYQQLSEQGFRVRLASDGYEAISQVRSARPDLIILDVMMPEISGFDVAAMLKHDPETEGIPIIILSIIQDRRRGIRLGIDRFLNKPTEAGELIEEINALLSRGASQRRVLVVDSEEPTIASISQLLTAQGYEVVGSSAGPDCLEEVRDTKPDMVILGSMFHGHEETIRSIRFEKGLEHIYVVLLVDENESEG